MGNPTVVKKKTTTKHKCSFFQPKHKAGLHVTTEWENARADCKAKVDAIIKRCKKQNRKFRDIEFDIDNDQRKCLYGAKYPDDGDEVYSVSGVRRVTQIFDNPQFFVDGTAHPSDIIQGGLGDCWFLSALATMSSSKERLIEQFCVASDQEIGVYGFVFFRDMVPVPVIIDDMLYIKIPKYNELNSEEKLLYHNDEDEYNRRARKGGQILFFAQSEKGETWVPLVEKAFAKLHGDYASLSGGFTGEGIEDMTGGVTFYIPTIDILDQDRFWKEELRKANNDRLFACSTSGLDSSRTGGGWVTERGLIGGHAYSVIRAVEYNGKRFLIVRNPWGDSEWTGRWSDGSKEWTKEWLPALDALEYSFGTNGQFVMEYEDFLQYWETIDRTLLFDDSWVMSSHWLKVTTHSMPAACTYGDVSFTINIPAPSYTVIVLSQLDSRYFKDLDTQAQWSFDFMLFKKGEPEPIAPSLYSMLFYARSVNLEVELAAGEYVLHVRLDRQVYDQADRETAVKEWNQRKLARVLTERCKSQSIAANFKLEERPESIPVPLNELGGRDLGELEEKAKEAIENMKKIAAELHAPEETAKTEEKKEEEEEEEEEEEDEEDEEETKEETKEEEKKEEEKKDDDTAKAEDENGEAPAPAPVSGIFDSDDTIYLGLHVYTNKDAPSEVHGQLRHEMGVVFHGLAALTGLPQKSE